MTDQNRDEDLMDRFLRGELDASQQKVWDHRMQDARFREQLEEMDKFVPVFQAEGRRQLKKQMATWEANRSGGGLRKLLRPWRPLMIAASAALLIGMLSWLWLRPASPDTLANAYFGSYENILMPVTRDQEAASDLEKGFLAYEAGRYADAAALLAPASETDDRIAFYRGLALLGAGQAEEAGAILRPLANRAGFLFQKPAQWYAALSALALTDTGEAADRLQAIAADQTHPFQEEARALLRDLR